MKRKKNERNLLHKKREKEKFRIYLNELIEKKILKNNR